MAEAAEVNPTEDLPGPGLSDPPVDEPLADASPDMTSPPPSREVRVRHLEEARLCPEQSDVVVNIQEPLGQVVLQAAAGEVTLRRHQTRSLAGCEVELAGFATPLDKSIRAVACSLDNGALADPIKSGLALQLLAVSHFRDA